MRSIEIKKKKFTNLINWIEFETFKHETNKILGIKYTVL